MKTSFLQVSICILFCILFSNQNLIAQVSINNDNSNPDASAILDIKSTDKGMLIPRMTTTQRNNISNAATGLLVFDTNTDSFWFRDGSGWQEQQVVGDQTTIQTGITKVGLDVNADNDQILFQRNNSTTISLSQNSNGYNRLGYPSAKTLIGENTGSKGTFYGYNAGNVSNTANTAFGTEAGNGQTVGQTISIGSSAGMTSVASSRNTLIGHNAGQNLTGQNNIAVGFESAQLNPNTCISLGYQAGQQSSAAGGFYIDNTNTNTPLFLGNSTEIEINGTLKAGGNIGMSTSTIANSSANTGAQAINLESCGCVGIGIQNAGSALVFNKNVRIDGNILFSSSEYLLPHTAQVVIHAGYVSSSGTITQMGGGTSVEAERISTGYYKLTIVKNSTLKPLPIVTAYQDGANDVNRYALIEEITNDFNDYFIYVEIRNHNGNKQDAPFNFMLFFE